MKVFIIDNYDSFTYNLYQYIGEILETEVRLGRVSEFTVVVRRNDEVTIEDIKMAHPNCIIVSPGPGSPDEEEYFGVCSDVILKMGKTIPVLGVCLGMQGIVHCFGGKVVKAHLPMHGKISPIDHNGEGVFQNVPNHVDVMRYHSLIAEESSFPYDVLEITARVGDKNLVPEIMGVKHKEYPIYGIQFHPESFATEGGKEMLRNFLFMGQRD
jgi:anthranilate synthase component 2